MRRVEEIQAQYDLLIDPYYMQPTTPEDLETRAAALVANQELLNQARAEQKEAKREYKKWYRRYKYLNIQLRGPEAEIAYITRQINKAKRVVEDLEQTLKDLKEKERLENLRREGLDDDIKAAEDKYKTLQEQGNPADDASTDN
jgi:chromosome segregation ATPase